MRVLHVISEMGTGGAETLVAGMVRAGADFGWESGVAGGGGHRADALRAAGYPVYHVPVARRTLSGLRGAAVASRAAVRKFEPDIVLAHNVSASVVARLALLPKRTLPLVTVFHGVAAGEVRSAARILRRTSTAVVVVASAMTEQLPGAVVIPNAVFPRFATIDRAAVRAMLGISATTPVVLCTARLEPQKRHDVLLRAWAVLGCEAVLLLAGDGSLRADLERYRDDLALGDRVRFLGNRSDVPNLLAAADLTVLTSDWEGMPVAVLESLAASRAVVATDVDGVREAVGDGGIVVPKQDHVATARAIRTLLLDPARRAAAATAGFDAVRRDHDPHTLMKSYDELLRGFCEEGR